jgi:hypothetical protein
LAIDRGLQERIDSANQDLHLRITEDLNHVVDKHPRVVEISQRIDRIMSHGATDIPLHSRITAVNSRIDAIDSTSEAISGRILSVEEKMREFSPSKVKRRMNSMERNTANNANLWESVEALDNRSALLMDRVVLLEKGANATANATTTSRVTRAPAASESLNTIPEEVSIIDPVDGQTRFRRPGILKTSSSPMGSRGRGRSHSLRGGRGRGGRGGNGRHYEEDFDPYEGGSDDVEPEPNDKYPYHPLLHPRLLDIALKQYINPIPSSQSSLNPELVEYIGKLRDIAQLDPSYNEPVLKPASTAHSTSVSSADSEGFTSPFLVPGDAISLSKVHPTFSGTLSMAFLRLIQLRDQDH